MLLQERASDMSLKGIDISHHNGIVDFDTIRRETYLDFVICKATEGATYTDILFYDNIKEARANELLVGAYHYYRGTSHPHKQAEHFVNVVKNAGDDLLLAIDVEDEELKSTPAHELAIGIADFWTYTKQRTGASPLIYVSDRLFINLGYHLRQLNINAGGWIARYGPARISRNDFMLAIRQTTSRGQVSGIAGKVDLDIAYMSESAWLKYAGKLSE